MSGPSDLFGCDRPRVAPRRRRFANGQGWLLRFGGLPVDERVRLALEDARRERGSSTRERVGGDGGWKPGRINAWSLQLCEAC